MSVDMLLGVLRQPFEDKGDIHLIQLKRRCLEAANLIEENEKEQGRWQNAIYKLIIKNVPDNLIDGAFCDSGDPLDFTLEEVSQAIVYFKDKVDELEQQNATLRARLQPIIYLAEKYKGYGLMHDGERLFETEFHKEMILAVEQTATQPQKYYECEECGCSVAVGMICNHNLHG